MEQALIQVGLPVKCSWGDCGIKGNVKPKFVDPEHGGWYKSNMFRRTWYCPGHAENGRELDVKMHGKYATPKPEPADQTEASTEELYALLDN